MLKNTISSMVNNAIESNCNCVYPLENLREESLIPLCITSKEDEPATQVTYRAVLLSTTNYTAERLVGFVEEWRSSSTLVLSTDDSCPVEIKHEAAALCQLQTTAKQSPTSEGGVSTTTLIAALIAEFAFLATLFLVVALATAYFIKARRRW